MKKALLAVAAMVLVSGVAAVAQAEVRTDLPDGVIPAVPGGEGDVPCDVLLRYDDGTDDTPNSGPTLGYYSGQQHQFLGVRFTAPAGATFEVQSASWFSDFWVLPGTVDVSVYEVANPSNTTSASINVTAGGTFEVAFAEPICVPGGTDYAVMICPRVGVFGVVGEDLSGPDARSYWTAGDCSLLNLSTSNDYMIWSCVTPCEPTPTTESTWGAIKSNYR